MRDAERLDQLREDAGRKEKAAQDREADRDRQAGHVTRYADKAALTAHRAGTGRDKLAQALREAATTAADASCAQQHQAAVAALDGTGLESTAWSTGRRSPPAERADGEHRAVAAYLDAPEAPAADILARARRDAQAVADRQAQAVAQLEPAARGVRRDARGQLRAAQEAEGRLSAEVQAAADRVTAADLAVEERMRLLLDGLPLVPERPGRAAGGRSRRADRRPGVLGPDRRGRESRGRDHRRRGPGGRRRAWPTWPGSSAVSGPGMRRGRASWRRRSADCARAATTPRRSRIRGPPASATAVPARRCGR